MNLYLVQHAEAKPEAEDPDRPLSDKGRADIREVASFLSGLTNIQLNSIFHSGKTRARQTAELLSEYLHPTNGVGQRDGLKPLDDPSIWEEQLAGLWEDVMLVGHLPHLSKLAARLLGLDEDRKVVDFQMGGVICLGRDNSAAWSVRWMIIPGILH